MLSERLERLRTVPGVGPITALTWLLEVGYTSRFRSIKQAISYCGLCGAEKSSADKVLRTPPLQTAQQAYPPHAGRDSPTRSALQRRTGSAVRTGAAAGERQSRHARRGTKDGAHMLAVDRRKTNFIPEGKFRPAAAA